MAIAFLLVALSAVVLVACVQHARSQGAKSLAQRALRRTRALPPRPADDLPPAGLGPLIPSPRAIATEFERGLREITLFLAVQQRD